MTKKISGIILVLMLALCSFLHASAEAIYTEDNIFYLYKDGSTSALLTLDYIDYKNYSLRGNVYLPSKIKGYTATSIDKMGFINCVNMTGLIIPNTIKTISSQAFMNCKNLKTVTIPKSVTTIEEYAFMNCDAVTDVYYDGSKVDWENIDIQGISNYAIRYANIHFAQATRVTGVALVQTSLSMAQGETAKLDASITPYYADNLSVTWSSSNTKVASVSSNGVITANATGSTVITVKTADGGYTAKCNVTVTAPRVTGVTLNRTSATMKVGDKITLTASVSPSNAANKTVVWGIKNPSITNPVALVSGGVVEAHNPGTTTIFAKTEDGGYEAECVITVIMPVSGVKISQSDAVIEKGESLSLSAEVFPSNAKTKSVTWLSSNPSAATVNERGVVRGVSEGSAIITVKTIDGGFTDTCSITVTPVSVREVVIDPEKEEIPLGENTKLYAEVLPEKAENKELIWESSNPTIAEVTEEGTVIPKAVGTAVIKAVSADSSVEDSCEINVIDAEKGIFPSDNNKYTVNADGRLITAQYDNDGRLEEVYSQDVSANEPFSITTQPKSKIMFLTGYYGIRPYADPIVND